jgi:hypothetical protein
MPNLPRAMLLDADAICAHARALRYSYPCEKTIAWGVK